MGIPAAIVGIAGEGVLAVGDDCVCCDSRGGLVWVDGKLGLLLKACYSEFFECG